MNGFAVEYWEKTSSIKQIISVNSPGDSPEGWEFIPEGSPLPTASDEPLYEEKLSDLARSKALSLRDSELRISTLRIDPLRDASEDGVATEEELAKLKLWKDYRIALNRIEGQKGFPNNISWPESPED